MMIYELDDIERAALKNLVLDRADLNDGRPLIEIEAKDDDSASSFKQSAVPLTD